MDHKASSKALKQRQDAVACKALVPFVLLPGAEGQPSGLAAGQLSGLAEGLAENTRPLFVARPGSLLLAWIGPVLSIVFGSDVLLKSVFQKTKRAFKNMGQRVA